MLMPSVPTSGSVVCIKILNYLSDMVIPCSIRITATLTLLSYSLVGLGQIKSEAVSAGAISGSISYQGKTVQALRYQDATGNYITLLTQTGLAPLQGSDDNRQKNLYAYTFQLHGTAAPVLTWQLHDGVTDCIADVVAAFIPETFAVTDLDKNGIAEIWVMYRTACRGDVSPSEVKIIMHEGRIKYAVRGTGKLKVGNQLQPGGGNYHLDAAFARAPAVFRQYVQHLWERYQTEHM